MSIIDFTVMTCTECPSTSFLRTIGLKWKRDSGLVPHETGYQCAQCGNTVDTDRLIRRAQVKQMEQELAAKKEEMRDLEDVAPAPKTKAPKEKVSA